MRRGALVLVACVWAGAAVAQALPFGYEPSLAPYVKKTDGPALKAAPICSNASIPSGNTLSNTTASEQAFASTCALSLAPGDFVICRLTGVFTIPALNIPSLTGTVKINGTPVLTTVSIPGLIAGTNLGWGADFTFWVPAAGGAVDAQGRLYATTGGTSEVPAGMANASAYVMDTANLTVSFVAKWSNNSGGSSITLRQVGCK